MTKRRIQSILANIDNLITDLHEISDDIWLNIDHNDSEAAKQGLDIKIKYNEMFKNFSYAANQLRQLIQDVSKKSSQKANIDSTKHETIITKLNEYKPHSIDNNFTFKRPLGFKIGDTPFIDTTSWVQVYETICRNLAEKNPPLFQQLPDDSKFMGKKGYKWFSRDVNELHSGREFVKGIFAEVNLSANQIRDRIKRLLNHFSIPYDTLTLYLRDDQDSNTKDINLEELELDIP